VGNLKVELGLVNGINEIGTEEIDDESRDDL
jgi:hypothetical protein